MNYTDSVAMDALKYCKDLSIEGERRSAIRQVDSKIDDKQLGIAQLKMILIATIVLKGGEL